MRKRQSFFNQAANNWDEKYANPALQAFLEKLVPSFGLLAGQNVLDVGTGTGILIPFLHEVLGSKGHITAIDYAKNMANICRVKFGHLPNVSIMVDNAENLQFSDNSFDVITCFGLFPHLDNKEATLNQFHRVLKSKGRLIIAHALSSEEIRSHHQNAPPVVANDVLPNDTEMRKLLQQTGFIDIEIVDKHGSYLCTSTKQ